MKALITGITGQDGSFLAELLLSKGYQVFGVIRRSSSFNTGRIDHLYRDPHEPDARLKMIYGDLNDGSSLNKILRQVEPHEIYNLGAQSHVRESFVTRKITRAATRIKCGLQKKLYLGNLEARRDWGFAGDHVEAMWLMMQAEKADDYVIATGESHSVRDLLDQAFGLLEMDWK